jgi:CspA family cold shock protein
LATGRVKWFSDAKRFGFIAPDDGPQDVFVHVNAIADDVPRTLRSDQAVEYSTRMGPKGLQAVSVRPVARQRASQAAPELVSYAEAVKQAGPAAREIRDLARTIAADARRAGASARADLATLGWPLWTGTTGGGETMPRAAREGYLFSWWQYDTTLWLRLDGELVGSEQSGSDAQDRRSDSPNGTARGPTPRPLDDHELFYPDAVQWESIEDVQRAPARTITDRYKRPRTLRRPLGAGIRRQLETIRTDRSSPVSILPAPSTPPPLHPARQSRWSWRTLKP